MKELDKYLNNFYLEQDTDYIFTYQFVKVNENYGLLCYEACCNPEKVFVDDDFPANQEDSIDFLKSFIPELDKNCKAKQISEGHYHEISSRILDLKVKQETVSKQIKDFVKHGLGEKI